MRPYSRLVSLAVLALLATAMMGAKCDGNRTRIGDILADPSKYDGKEVSIAGKVDEAAGAFGVGAFYVDDGSGRILVVSSTGVPREGARVGVRGEVESDYTFGSQTYTVLKQSERFEP